jgi:hypothetical protein
MLTFVPAEESEMRELDEATCQWEHEEEGQATQYTPSSGAVDPYVWLEGLR